MRRFYLYDPAPTLRNLREPLLGIFGELDTPKGVELNVKAMTASLSAAANQDFTIRVFPNGRHNLMDMSGVAPNEFARLASQDGSTQAMTAREDRPISFRQCLLSPVTGNWQRKISVHLAEKLIVG